MKLLTNRFRINGLSAEALNEAIAREFASIEGISRSKRQTFFQFGEASENPLPDVPRMASGITRLDLALGGGFGKGEGFLVIGAMGTGKTAFCSQLATSFSARGSYKGLIISTEATAAQIERRMVSNYCNIPYQRVVHGINRSQLDPVALTAYEGMLESLRPRLCIVEWPKGSSRSVITGFKDELKRARDGMDGLDYIALDWIGGALGDIQIDPGKVRMTYQIAGDLMGRLAEEEGISTISFAQAHVDRGINKPLIDSRALAECKQIGREMVGIIGISAMYSSQENLANQGPTFAEKQIAFVSKVRVGTGGVVNIRRDMTYQRFIDW